MNYFSSLLICLTTLFLSKVTAQETTASSQVSTFTIEAPQLEIVKKIWVYLPKSYNSSTKKYPVIYMLDGQNLFDKKTAIAEEWNIDETLDSINAKIIVIGIESSIQKRTEELLPFNTGKYGAGKANALLDFIVKTLKPKIDTTYRTKTNTRNTAIFGSSMGGLTSFYASLRHPEVFGKAACFSPAFEHNQNELNAFLKNTKKFNTKIYFLYNNNKENDTTTLSELNAIEYWINSKRCECQKLNKKVIVKSSEDNEKLWRKNFKKAYLWLF